MSCTTITFCMGTGVVGVKDAVVVDIGGTSTDVGMLTKGFPRQASASVEVGLLGMAYCVPESS